MSKVVVRDYNEQTDKGFVYSTALKGLFHGCEFYNKIERTSFFKNYGKVLDMLLQRPDVTIKVATLDDDADVILGYIILGPETVHYCFVKEAWRAKGIANLLLGSHIVTGVSHITKPGNAIRLKKLWTFDPFRI